mmetsp:Transcript_18462/g.21872  ORF Transcript_18462/g.21872 Transcript_18462/m.21872 type:complete len:621 (+) Transcript_18462:86-1948(+)
MRRPNLAVSTSLVQDNIPAPLPCCPKLFIGSIHAAFNIEKMKEFGITHVVNASGLPPTYPRNFSYLSVEVRDKSYAPILGCIPAANIFIEAGIEQGGGVLVHCAGGRSRSAAIIMAFLMSTHKQSFDEAMAYCFQARDLVNVNPGFQIQLRAYYAADCDIHTAHQILLHKRLERFGERLQRNFSEEKKDCDDDGQDSPSSSMDAKVEVVLSLLDTSSASIQPRLRLSRPASPAIQVIPPLRALERNLSCRKCGQSLFSYANVVLLDIDHEKLDIVSWAKEYVLKNSKGVQPFASPAGSARVSESNSEPHSSNSSVSSSNSASNSASSTLRRPDLDAGINELEMGCGALELSDDMMAKRAPQTPSVPRGGGGFGRSSRTTSEPLGASGGSGGGFGRQKEIASSTAPPPNSESRGGGGGGGFGRAEAKESSSPHGESLSSDAKQESPLSDAKEGYDNTDRFEPLEQPPNVNLHHRRSSNTSLGSNRSSPVVPVLNFACGNRYDVRRRSISNGSISSQQSLQIQSSSSPSNLRQQQSNNNDNNDNNHDEEDNINENNNQNILNDEEIIQPTQSRKRRAHQERLRRRKNNQQNINHENDDFIEGNQGEEQWEDLAAFDNLQQDH